jgi:hypothetical protein
MNWRKLLSALSILIGAVIIIASIITRHTVTEKRIIPNSEGPRRPFTITIDPEISTQKSGAITFEYHLNSNLPEEWFGGTYVKSEKVYFNRKSDGSWNTIQASPVLKDLGPLLLLDRVEDLSNKSGNCGINTYPADEDTSFPITYFQPVCDEISNEEIATITFGLKNCTFDNEKYLLCLALEKDSLFLYTLNSDLNKFEFYFIGAWNSTYEYQIRETLSKLSFQPIEENYFVGMVPKKEYRIDKTNP